MYVCLCMLVKGTLWMLGCFILMGVAGFGFFLAHNNGETLEGLIFLRIVMCRPIWTKLRGWWLGKGWVLSGPTKGLWVTVVSGAAAVGRDGNPGRPPRRGTKQTNGAQRFKECGTMKADGWAERGLSLQCPGSMSQPGLRSKPG